MTTIESDVPAPEAERPQPWATDHRALLRFAAAWILVGLIAAALIVALVDLAGR